MPDLPNPPFSMGDDMKKKFGYSTKNQTSMGRKTTLPPKIKSNPHGSVRPRRDTPIPPSNPMPNLWMRILKKLGA